MIRIVLTASLFLALPLSAHANELPPRKAGLWEVRVRMAAPPPQAITRHCVGPGRDWKVDNCSKHEVSKADNGYVIDSICRNFTATVISKNFVVGDFETGMTISGEVRAIDVPGLDPNFVAKFINDLRYLGPCEAGQSPGDIISFDGKITPWSAQP